MPVSSPSADGCPGRERRVGSRAKLLWTFAASGTGLRPARWSGFIGAFGVTRRKLRHRARYSPKLVDVTPSMPAAVLLTPDEPVEPALCTLEIFVLRAPTGPGSDRVRHDRCRVRHDRCRVRHDRCRVRHDWHRVHLPPMPDIPHAIDSRSFRSSASTEIEIFRRALRAKILRSSCSSCDLIGLTLCERCVKPREHTSLESTQPGPRIRIPSDLTPLSERSCVKGQ